MHSATAQKLPLSLWPSTNVWHFQSVTVTSYYQSKRERTWCCQKCMFQHMYPSHRGRWLGSNYFCVKALVKFKTITAADACCKRHNREVSWESLALYRWCLGFLLCWISQNNKKMHYSAMGLLTNMRWNIKEPFVLFCFLMSTLVLCCLVLY